MLALSNRSTDPAAFDTYYAETHTPIAKKIPGLRSFLVSIGPIVAPDGSPAPYHQIAELIFDSMTDLRAGLSSPEGRASAGVSLTPYETRDAWHGSPHPPIRMYPDTDTSVPRCARGNG